ncbi:hypothetical protein [Gluconobacter wancherniae]|uniref:hypothetical protein n=1 Tax=Gluconobacter wancherniae TaxID=1307955 RepID=UPI0011BD53F2|nr:hypothetical protein [Gluconobacter wancherniae]MBF0852555.1 hypothetical protein [Gluconobacter wancherniae]MBS1062105.1 hypothetical protein [Gluconobacter wancherniae]MBS1087435.1 hypothetical protein [Gluconobacter wancherniae]MBS1093123.1 hypothetical protein [Gluconobacter wancherniae]GBD56733.1 hypothetical protein NBRC103581_01314 [Gluconobacter wancherniae NBRC 103581]
MKHALRSLVAFGYICAISACSSGPVPTTGPAGGPGGPIGQSEQQEGPPASAHSSLSGEIPATHTGGL